MRTFRILLIVSLLISAAICVQASQWPMYRHDLTRTGMSDADALLGTRPVPIWTFPYPEKGVDPVDNDFGVKDDPNFVAQGPWTEADSIVSPNAYQGNFLYAAANSGATATWTFPLATQYSQMVGYYVYIWFPSHAYDNQPQHASNARYTVEVVNDNGSVVSTDDFLVDQISGGNWMVLRSSPYLVRDDQFMRVSLTSAGADGIVIADGVSLVHDLGSVLSSPALATNGNAQQEDDLVITCVTENRPLETVKVDTIGADPDGNTVPGQATVQSGSIRVGTVYGVAAEDNTNTGGLDERGIAQWWFPYNTDNWIAGGFSSSPVIRILGGEEMAYCAALDGQLYVLRTVRNNTMLDSQRIWWQGPGYIEDPVAPSWSPGTHSGFQGDGYLQADAVGTNGAKTTAKWTFDLDGEGRYSFYAWIPPSTSNEVQIPDAAYLIKIGTDPDLSATADQRSGGRWALLGSYQVDLGDSVSVELSNVSDTMNAQNANARYVAADAIKVVPAHLGVFDWSSPAVSSDGTRVYIGTSSGRLFCFDVSDPNKREPVWVYPAADENPMGAIEASPTIDGSTIYVGSADGHVYAVGTNGTEKWVYPAKPQNPGDPVEVLGQISSTIAVFEATNGKKLCFGVGSDSALPPIATGPDTAGRIICLDANTSAVDWMYPAAGDEARGSFLWSSPLIDIDRLTIAIGSSDGHLIGLDLGGNPAWADFPDLGREIYSSAGGAMVTSEGIPMGYVGTQGGTLHGVDLRAGNKHWSYGLLGAVVSSPAIAEGRIYVGDMSGITWAFSTRAGSGPGDLEAWNYDISLEGPPGNDDSGGSDKESAVEVDIFNRDEWIALTPGIQVPSGVITDGDLHKIARAEQPGEYPNDRTFRYEWGETAYIIAWNCLDPNDPELTDPEYQWVKGKKRGDKYILDTDSTVRLTIKTRGPGDQSDQSTAVTMSEKGAFMDKDGKVIHYTKYAYVLGTSSSSSTQAPGSRITVSAQELPSTKTGSVNKGATAGDCVVPEHPIPTEHTPDGDVYDHDKYKAQIVSINNPLGLVYDGSGVKSWIAVNPTVWTTTRNIEWADRNGNRDPLKPSVMPWVRGGSGDLVAHGTNSDERVIDVCDRSLLYQTGNRLSKFRVERNDLEWTGGPKQIWTVGGIRTDLPWETLPPEIGSNTSWDYPDIRSRQVGFAMAESRLDPTIENADLRPAGGYNAGSWTAGRTPVVEVVSVPRFQPPNESPDQSDTVLSATGYTGRAYVFIDSNNDGRLNRPGSMGSSNLYQQSVTGARAEAYREFYTQVHVPPDYRVEVGEKTYDIGSVPHGFGLTTRGAALPAVFGPTMLDNATLPARQRSTNPPPTGPFDRWFKEFTAYNYGNVNLLNLRMTKRDLFSDTAEGGVYGGGSYGAYIPGAGIRCDLDRGRRPLGFDDDPDYPAMVGKLGASRTFNKPRVTDNQPTVLRLPDKPKWYRVPSVDPVPPFFSVAVPIGTPVGTYSQILTLFEDFSGDGRYQSGESVGNPLMEVKVTVTENQMTDGSFLGALPQVDPLPAGSTGDVTPAVYRDPYGGLQMFWSSNRLAPGGVHAAGDPWFLYRSSLTLDANGYWNLAVPAPAVNAQWWTPIATPYPTPTLDVLKTFFNGGPGTVQLNSAKFSSPSIAQDPATGQAWLFFGGEATRDQAAGTTSKPREYKAFYWKLDPDGTPSAVTGAISSTRDWTMPKYGVRGSPGMGLVNTWGDLTEPPVATQDLFTLWTFWYGGNNNQWRIYYNMSPKRPDPTDRFYKPLADRDSWSNDGQLEIARGLVSAAEPSIVPRRMDDGAGKRFQALDVIYSAYSQYHRNADIYLSRYEPQFVIDPETHKPVFRKLNMLYLPEVRDEILTRDPASAIYSSKHVDWKRGNFEVRVNGPSYAGPLNVDLREYPEYPECHATSDPQTSALIYTYAYPEDPPPGDAPLLAKIETLKTLKVLFRTVVIDPAAGTVKFLRDPGRNAEVKATYVPRAYRLTTDEGADTSPCALFDNNVNPRAMINRASFSTPSGWDWDTELQPSNPNPRATVDRLWMLWRRPSTATKGTSIYYKSFRYTIPMDSQVTMNAGNNVSFSPEPKGPVEIDWAKKRLYFTAVDDGKAFDVSYPTSLRTTATDFAKVVTLQEELDVQGNSFGHLTSEVANEGQVCAIRDADRYFSKLWVFWTSARKGNTDVYYESICPRFYAREFN